MTDLVLRRWTSLWSYLRGMDAVWLIVLAIPLVVLTFDSKADAVLGTAIEAFAGTLPYMAVAIGLIAMLKATGAEGVVSQAFQGRETQMILFAALIGGLAPFCSCEVIPFVAALLAAGTPLSAVMAFWLSSPLMDPPAFAITAGALGIEFAVGKTVAAVGVGLMGGFVTMGLLRAGFFPDPLKKTSAGGGCGCGPNPLNGKPVWRFWNHADRRETFRDAALENALFLGKWLALAYLLEGLLIHHVPAEQVGAVVGGEGLWPIVLGALVGAPAYLNGYAAPALVAGLMEQGMSDGAAMSFLVAGAVSCIPAMAAVFALVKRPVFLLYVSFGIVGAIISGVIFTALV
ncbi:MAG: permease [Pseudomonadota bacterium]